MDTQRPINYMLMLCTADELPNEEVFKPQTETKAREYASRSLQPLLKDGIKLLTFTRA